MIYKLNGPGSATVEGHTYAPNKDGVFEVPEAHARVLIESHGFTPVVEKAEPKRVDLKGNTDEPSRADMLEFLKDQGIEVAHNISNAKLRPIYDEAKAA